MSLTKRLFDVVRANLNDLEPGGLHLQDWVSRPASERLGDELVDPEPLDPQPELCAQHRRWYKDLGVDPGASVDSIRQAYRRQMRLYHPDRFASDPAKLEMATQVARGLTEAYNGLMRLQRG